MGPGTFLKDRKFCKDGFQFFFLQGPKLKRDIFAGTNVIFKPFRNIKFLKLKNTLDVTFSLPLKLVDCDEQLLKVGYPSK